MKTIEELIKEVVEENSTNTEETEETREKYSEILKVANSESLKTNSKSGRNG